MAEEDDSQAPVSDAPAPPKRRWQDHARWVFFLLFVLYVWGGPASKQLFGKSTKAFHAWDMFSSYGLNLIVGEFYEVKDGEEIPVDHILVLGHPKRYEAPMKLRRIIGNHKLDLVVRDVCGAVPKGTDLRLRSQIAKIDGWKVHHQGDQNLCSKAETRARNIRIRGKKKKRKSKQGNPQVEVKKGKRGSSKGTRGRK